MGNLSKKQLTQQHNVYYLMCEGDANNVRNCKQRLLSKLPALTELTILLAKQIDLSGSLLALKYCDCEKCF